MTASTATSAAPAPIARIALVRDRGAMLGGPLLVIAAAAVLIAVSLLALPVPLSLVGVALGGALALAGALVAIRTWSLRLQVEPDYLHLTGLATDRRYHLVPGQLSRLPTAGPRRAQLRVRIGALGWAVGRARLAGGEQIEVIRLGASPAVILVPTERGRVALAVRSESELVAALTAAAQRRAERPVVATAAAMTTAPAPAPAASSAAVALAPAVAASTAPPPPMPTPGRPLTGIERMALEERLAQERRAAMYGARSEQAAASFSASVAALPASSTVTPATRPAASIVPRPVAQPVRRRSGAPMARRVSRPTVNATAVLIGAPLLGALLVWGLALWSGAAPAADGLDPITAAVLLIGPATALAVLLSRNRWPRLAGLTVASAMIALLLAARGVIG